MSSYTPVEEPPGKAELTALARLPDSLSILRALRHRNYRLFFSGQVVSLMGTWMQKMAQSWLVYRLTDSPWFLGITIFCASASIFFIAPFGGMIADRVDRRKMLIFTQSAAMVQAAILASLTLTGVVEVWHIIVLALALGLIDGFDVPSRHSLTLDMVGAPDLRAAIALNSILFNFARIIGPGLAAAAIAAVGEGACFALNAVSFAAVLTGLIRMRVPPRAPRIARHPLHEIAEGYRYSLSRPAIRSALLLVAVSSMFGAAYITLTPAIARDVLHGAEGSYGALMAASGAGALIGAYMLSRFPERWLARTPALAAILFGLGLMAYSRSHALWLSIILLVPTAAALMLLGGATNTVIQLSATPEYRGRSISHYTQCFLGMMPWGALLLGGLASHIGAAHSIAIGGGIVALAGVFMMHHLQIKP